MPVVTVEDHGAIAIIRINRPERLNAIGQAVAVEMQRAFLAFDADQDKRVAVVKELARRAYEVGFVKRAVPNGTCEMELWPNGTCEMELWPNGTHETELWPNGGHDTEALAMVEQRFRHRW